MVKPRLAETRAESAETLRPEGRRTKGVRLTELRLTKLRLTKLRLTKLRLTETGTKAARAPERRPAELGLAEARTGGNWTLRAEEGRWSKGCNIVLTKGAWLIENRRTETRRAKALPEAALSRSDIG
ncbi:MAG: hypothetical protein O7C63_04180 [Alphaproteobacteria bacterium]|nr:hypothetical protein [Alphaproteobacteria bacterium]MCZ6764115.1 hypothetical protein [Alphaproteobacteria bacterium]